jgi:hypothetical protein
LHGRVATIGCLFLREPSTTGPMCVRSRLNAECLLYTFDGFRVEATSTPPRRSTRRYILASLPGAKRRGKPSWAPRRVSEARAARSANVGIEGRSPSVIVGTRGVGYSAAVVAGGASLPGAGAQPTKVPRQKTDKTHTSKTRRIMVLSKWLGNQKLKSASLRHSRPKYNHRPQEGGQ